jgi:small basic protein
MPSTMKRPLFVLLAALAVFCWQGTSWVALPFHAASLLPVKDEAAVAAVLKANLPTDGMYSIPGAIGDPDAVAARYAAGPVATIGYKAVGGQMMSPGMFVRGILLDLFVTALLAYLLGMARIDGYLQRLLFVSLIGLTLGLFTNLNNWNWMSQSLHYSIVDAIDTWVAWTLGGAVLAKVSPD